MLARKNKAQIMHVRFIIFSRATLSKAFLRRRENVSYQLEDK